MTRFYTLLLICLLSLALPAAADGLLLPADHARYPYDFLRHRLTRVTVNLHGLVAETAVYQEFENEWYDSTDAVYAFPLPPEARATRFLYWRNDSTFQAVLKVRQQVPNPGTGEDPVVAHVNQYLGRNGIRIELRGIAPGAIQAVELRYVSRCDYFRGQQTYRYPLATGEFVRHPLDHLQFNIEAQTNSDIVSYNMTSIADHRVLQFEPRQLRLEMIAPKTYINRDFEFHLKTNNVALGVDFYSVANDTMDGHYALFVRPPDEAGTGDILPKRVVFLLGNSTRMFGYKLESSLTVIAQAIDLLSEQDYFNILVFNNSVQHWQSQAVQGTPANRESAKQFLASVTVQSGTRLDLGLEAALRQFPDDHLNNTILLFTDGRSPVDPRDTASRNTYRAGIFAIAIGDDIDRARLEMTSALNYGFVTYFRENDDLGAGMLQVFAKISEPILKEVGLEFGRAGAYEILPATLPSTYAGSHFFVTGRYRNPGTSALSIAGTSSTGLTAYDFQLNFRSDTQADKFAESIWAKEAIDALEREIEVYGETPSLKDSLIALSLRYGIRCRYTAYIADYETVVTGVEEESEGSLVLPRSYLIGNYPNPFNPTTLIEFYLGQNADHATVKFIRIYNALGRLVAIFDLSKLAAGMHTIRFDGRDFSGRRLPSGIYFVRLQINSEVSTLRILLLK